MAYNTYNTAAHDLPDIHALGPWVRTYISGKSLMAMLYLLYVYISTVAT